MKLSSFVVLAVAACAGALSTAQAQEAAGKAQAAAFDKRMFAGPLGAKSFACFVRRYDANHLAQHPKQKVSAMKLMVEAETVPEDKTVNYSFRVAFSTAIVRAISTPAATAITRFRPKPAASRLTNAASIVRAVA